MSLLAPRMSPSERLKAFVVRDALPLWSSQGRSEIDGGFHEALDVHGEPIATLDRRIRVQFRQIAVFSQAYLNGEHAYGDQIALQALEYAERAAWAADGRGGWASKVSVGGRIVEPARLAYDHAFAIYGLSWCLRATGDPRARRLLWKTIDFIDTHLDDGLGGYLTQPGAQASCRLQNPLMHFLEAWHALYDATGDVDALRRAEKCRLRFLDSIVDRRSGQLLEAYAPDWARSSLSSTPSEEPGHAAEWAWLLSEHAQLTGRRSPDAMNQLLTRAKMRGVGADGFLVDELDGDGQVRRATRRLWPQTEFIRACLSRHRDTDCPTARILAEHAIGKVLSAYLDKPFSGGWVDQFDARGQVISENVPASTLYHIYGAHAAVKEVLSTTSELSQLERVYAA